MPILTLNCYNQIWSNVCAVVSLCVFSWSCETLNCDIEHPIFKKVLNFLLPYVLKLKLPQNNNTLSELALILNLSTNSNNDVISTQQEQLLYLFRM